MVDAWCEHHMEIVPQPLVDGGCRVEVSRNIDLFKSNHRTPTEVRACLVALRHRHMEMVSAFVINADEGLFRYHGRRVNGNNSRTVLGRPAVARWCSFRTYVHHAPDAPSGTVGNVGIPEAILLLATSDYGALDSHVAKEAPTGVADTAALLRQRQVPSNHEPPKWCSVGGGP